MIRLEHVAKRLGHKQVLKDVNLEVSQGETCVVIGCSGMGKSVLLKHICALFRPDAGSILIEDEDIAPMRERELVNVRRKIGVLFQGAALFDSMSVAENVAFFLREQGETDEDKIMGKVAECLAMVKLPDTESVMPADLSGGMKKRVGLARALAMDPRIILYDEPTTGLDPITADAINDLIVDMREQLGVTSVAVTHDMASAFKIADTICMLHNGEIVYSESAEKTRVTQNPMVRQFIDGKANGPVTDIVS
jgi:phospholipid/cholesterol/gamma-HCH transport system ATP-binding protein